MSDVFVSYTRNNAVVVGRLVAALRAEGLDVWWDQDIAPNAAWEQTIEQQLALAQIVIVAWSPSAVSSEFVKAEARWARQQDRLLQVFVEPCDPPLFFGERQGLDLKGWTGAATDAAFRALVGAIREARGHPASAEVEPPVLPAADTPPAAPPIDAEPAVSSDILAHGTVLNGLFEVQRLVGAGAVGRLYEGRNVTTGERVAIKTFRGEVAGAIEGGFLREMSVLVRLSHPAIVAHRLVAREPTGGAFYIVSDFVDGSTLAGLIGQVTMPETKLRALTGRLADGLKHAHDLGVVHRDVSPASILVPGGRLDECQLIDFGVGEGLAPAGAAPGPYAAPEQNGEFGGEVGPWTDVYGLGVVILALATGRAPVRRAAAETAEGQRRVAGVSRAPRALKSLLEGMLADDRHVRFHNMDEVMRALGRKPSRSPSTSGRRTGDSAEARRRIGEAIRRGRSRPR
jgi:serine/threonine-protein kinase